jgi:DNA-binding PucR family transcriptional regulator
MREAKLLAGKSGMDSIVTAVSVLEYSDPPKVQEEIFRDREYLGSELVITAFASVGEDVDKQCVEIQNMSATGAVGMVLYYMGLFVKRLDKRVIDLADELGFAIICMPPNKYHLRYSESISGIQNAILMDQVNKANFVPEILETLSALPQSQQNTGTLLRILSDYLHISLILADSSWHLLSYAAWPTMLEHEVSSLIDKEIFHRAGESERSDGHLFKLLQIKNASGRERNLLAITTNEALSEDVGRQIASALQIFWKMSGEGDADTLGEQDLIRSIIGDEPIRMRKQARRLGVNEKRLHNLCLFCQSTPEAANDRFIIKTIKEKLSHYCKDKVVDSYSGDVIALLDDGISDQWLPMLREIKHTLDEHRIYGRLIYACNLENTSEVRNAYLTFTNAIDVALMLYPRSKLLSLHEILFAKSCQDSIDKGEAHIQEKMQILRILHSGNPKVEQELHETLAVFYFDAHMRTLETAEQMYIHQNTVKYRLRSISEKLGCAVTDMPEMLELYTALALERLLSE